MLWVLDTEVFYYDFILVAVNPFTEEEVEIVNDFEAFHQWHERTKNDLYIGYNIKGYDQWILRAALLEMNLKKLNDYIIVDGNDGWRYSDAFRKIPMYIYDVIPSDRKSLKVLEGFLGMKIKETDVDFDIMRKLTPEELQLEVEYCKHDVYATIEVLSDKKSMTDFKSQMSLINTFKFPLSYLSKTQAQLTAAALDCTYKERFDEWDIQPVETLRLNKYAYVRDWFLDKANHNYKKSFETVVCGVPHSFGWGGLHGAPETAIHRKGLIIHVDVNSYYPAIMIEYDLLSRNVANKDKFRQIRDQRIIYKKEGNPLQAPYKICINSMYGVTKDKNSAAYDPRQANNICINGQLLLLDLLEHLEQIPQMELIQSNTDGIILQIPDTDEHFQMVDDICYEWEQRTRMGLGFDLIDEIWQGDVNNYVFHFADVEENGKNRNEYERKGAYVKELSPLDYDLPIINKAIVDRLTKGIPVAVTIGECNDLMEFQKIVKITKLFDHIRHGQTKLREKCIRVFASSRPSDCGVQAYSKRTGTYGKIANTPEHCFIENEDVRGVKVEGYPLDKEWYIRTAQKRLWEKFGVDDGITRQLGLWE